MEFRSRAVRSLVDLHETEMRVFLSTFNVFVASGAPMPDAHGDEDYASPERLAGHVLVAACAYLVRAGEWLGRPVTDVDPNRDPVEATRDGAFADGMLAAYRRHLATVTDEELMQSRGQTRMGLLINVELLLEHAIVHPMRHRIQLQRLLGERGAERA